MLRFDRKQNSIKQITLQLKNKLIKNKQENKQVLQ